MERGKERTILEERDDGEKEETERWEGSEKANMRWLRKIRIGKTGGK